MKKTLLVSLLFFLSGACGLLYQVVWARKLVLLFGTTSYAVSTVLTIFFVGLAVGSVLGGRWADRTWRPLFLYGLIEVIIGLWAVLFILAVGKGEAVVVWILREGAYSREFGLLLRGLLSLAFLAVPVTLMGATLPLLARHVTADSTARGLRIGALYSINTFGAVTGCAMAGFWLLPALGYTRATVVGAGANLAVGALAIAFSGPGNERFPIAGSALSASRFRVWRRYAPWVGGAAFVVAVFYAFAYELLWPPLLAVVAPGLGIGLIAIFLSGRREGRPIGEESGGAETLLSRGEVYVTLAAFGLSGFCALALEVLWTRLLAIIFLGTTYAFTTMLATLLYGIAVGSAFASPIIDRRRRPLAVFGIVEIAIGCACLLMLPVIAAMPGWLRSISEATGYDWARLTQAKFFFSFLALFPPTFLFGTTFPIVVRVLARRSETIGTDTGKLYFANTLGGVLGALAGGYLIIPTLGTQLGILVLAGTLTLVGVGLILSSRGLSRPRKALLAAGAVAAFTFAASVMPGDVNMALAEGYVPKDNTIIAFQEGVEGTVAVSEPRDHPTGSDRALWINAVQATVSIEKGVKMNRFQGVLPLVFDRDPKRVLFMCFGSGITAGTLGLYDFDRIDAVEIARDVLDVAHLFEADNFGVMHNPRLRFIVDDGRNFLLTTGETYDLITFEPMPLALAGVSTFYTEQYYRLCLSRLSPGGMVSQWVPLHSLDPAVVRSLVYTFTRVFPEYCAWFVNSDLFLIGSDQPLRIDLARASERLGRPEIAAAMNAVGLSDLPEMLSCFFMGKEHIQQYVAKDVRPLTDDRPWAEFVAPKLIYRRTVQSTLDDLIPLFESPVPFIADNGVASPDQTSLIERIERRHQSKALVLEGVKAYYSGMMGGDPAEMFVKALEVDPSDFNARFYIKEIAVARAMNALERNDADQALAILETALGQAPDQADLHLKLGDIHFDRGDTAGARVRYERYFALGGKSARARERLDGEGNAASGS